MTFRDDRDALFARVEALEQERDALERERDERLGLVLSAGLWMSGRRSLVTAGAVAGLAIGIATTILYAISVIALIRGPGYASAFVLILPLIGSLALLHLAPAVRLGDIPAVAVMFPLFPVALVLAPLVPLCFWRFGARCIDREHGRGEA